MKLFCGVSEGTPPGGAIILGRLEGIVLAVGLAVGVGMLEASTMMLVPMTRDVALSVAVAVRDTIGGALLMLEDGLTGMEIEAASLGVAEGVAEGVSDVGGGVETTDDAEDTTPVPTDDVGNSLSVVLIVALLGEAVDEAKETSSDAGTLRDWLPEEVGTGEADVPTEPVPEGVMPELSEPVGRILPDSVAEGVMLAVSEGVAVRLEDRASEVGTPEEETTPDGTAPEGGRIPDETGTPDDGRMPDDRSAEDERTPVGTIPDDGKTPEDGRISDNKLEGKMVGTMTGPVPVGRAESMLDKMLDKALGTAEAGRSETADESREDTSGGRIPDALTEGTGVGAVAPLPVPEGRMPVTSDMTEDKSPGTSRSAELVAAVSEVGMAPELSRGAVGVAVEAAVSPVPRAVVIPMTMPELVGRTILPGIPPVEPS